MVAFSELAEAQSLAAANKRIVNILKKAGEVGDIIDPALFAVDAEVELNHALSTANMMAHQHVERGNYAGALSALAMLRAPVDRFFDDVMVNDDDVAVRANRLALLGQLAAAMNAVADISRLELKD